MAAHKKLLLTALLIALAVPSILYITKADYSLEACLNPPEYVEPDTCFDKIESSQRTERYEFQCKEGFMRSVNECIRPFSYTAEILNYSLENDTVHFMLKEMNNLYSGEYYYVECMPKGSSDAQEKRSGYRTTHEVAIQPLNPFTTYRCSCSLARLWANGSVQSQSAFGNAVEFQTGEFTKVCQSPLVLYQDECVEQYPPCLHPINNTAKCVDKIDNSERIERYSFSCLQGFEKEGEKCVEITKEEPAEEATEEESTETAEEETKEPETKTSPKIPAKEIPAAGYEEEVVTTTSDDNPFSDTNINSLAGKAAADLYSRAIIGGYPDGEFKGYRPVNRAEAAKFLLLSADIEVKDLKNNGRFWDVIEGQWYTKYVMTAAGKQIINGYSDNSFKPANTVNIAEFLKMLTLAFGLELNLEYSYLDVPSDAWFAQYAGIANKYDLFPNRTSDLMPAKELTREEVAIAIHQYLSNQ